MAANAHDLAAYIEHTELQPAATAADAQRAIELASAYGVRGVCISPSRLERAHLPSPGPTLVTVCGFPSGAHSAQVKAVEAVTAMRNGAQEIDVVINLGAAKAGEWGRVCDGIEIVRLALAEAAADQGLPMPLVKAIIETAILTDQEIVRACHAVAAAGADMVKTSTGFHRAGGATTHAVRLIAQTVAGAMGIKAAGSIRTRDDAIAMIEAGATRIGTTSTAAILV
ncbi:deoxyribose-phosphate aldolase [Rarobacter incanus]|uniref:Deoxyribose-phosphate aldolase n=1 Tax=Rarobacter incanus TaxID=153494 RepID=A0A542SN84_9MICO|nr:deoxyribose-phosphate aldolase [Rarobacter incanus]TQK76089.1 deoxyribose-phosphate aldolase [Rarobacter incanus]